MRSGRTLLRTRRDAMPSAAWWTLRRSRSSRSSWPRKGPGRSPASWWRQAAGPGGRYITKPRFECVSVDFSTCTPFSYACRKAVGRRTYDQLRHSVHPLYLVCLPMWTHRRAAWPIMQVVDVARRCARSCGASLVSFAAIPHGGGRLIPAARRRRAKGATLAELARSCAVVKSKISRLSA